MTNENDESYLFSVKNWIECFKFTRTKRSTIERDFSDASKK